MRGIVKMIGYIFAGLIILVAFSVFLFVNLQPDFGGKPTKVQKEKYKLSQNYREGKFVNQIPTEMSMDFRTGISVMREFIKGTPQSRPKSSLPVLEIDSIEIANKLDSKSRITWFGHSSFLIEMDGIKLLIDPMFSNTPAPHPALGPSRFTQKMPIEIEKLPWIDAVVISHDHYDHLDYSSIKKLNEKVGSFYVPLGVAPHLIRWGVDKDKIHELEWWDEIKTSSITLICSPSRHFSGRRLMDRFSTLWCSWIILGSSERIYFSGDSGYGPHFKEIGEAYGPFDLALLECGQYDKRWHNIHMLPEETVQAAIDVKAETMMPIHWGAFKLALHSWTDPVDRVSVAAKSRNVSITTPQIGESIIIADSIFPKSKWWIGL